jgi:twitching motility two-component system response regulator PilH
MAKIVIADDSPTLRRIVSSVLTREGHEVVQAEDGIGAVQAVFAHQPDAVVLDVQMPRVSGFIAARVLKDDWQTADIPVVMLTSLDAASDRYWAGQAGVDRYLTKDFEAPDLAEAIADVLTTATQARGGRPALRPDAVELTEEDVLSRVCDLLDRKLFESSVASSVTAIAATARGLEQSVASLLGVLQRFVSYDLAAVLLAEERAAYVAVGQPTAREHYDEFLLASAESVAGYGGQEVVAAALSTRVAQAGGLIVEDPEDLPAGPEQARMATFLSMPLRGHGGQVVGVLALSSGAKSAFGETALSTLKLVEQPAAIVIDNARLAGRARVPEQVAH